MNRLRKLHSEAFIRDKIRINPANIYSPPPPKIRPNFKMDLGFPQE